MIITAHVIERGYLSLYPVSIGNNCTIGMMSAILPQSSVDHGVSIAPMSMVPLGSSLLPSTTWEGSPVRPKDSTLLPQKLRGSCAELSTIEEGGNVVEMEGKPLHAWVINVIQTIGAVIAFLIVWISLLPLLVAMVSGWKFGGFFVAAIIAIGLVLAHIIYMLLAIALKWLVVGRMKPGRYNSRSAYAARVELVKLLLTSPFANNFCVIFAETPAVKVALRMLGADLDRACIMFKVNPLMFVGADQLRIKRSTYLGFEVKVLGAATVGNTLLIAPTIIGKQYVLNSKICFDIHNIFLG